MAFWNKRRPRTPEPEAPRSPSSDPALALRVVHAYHGQTKHHFQRYAAGPMELEWETQPDPFRRFAGAPTVSLPLPENDAGPDYGEALVEGTLGSEPLDLDSLSRLLYDSLAISAWKEAGDSRWALRVNPSSGNLHPTEGYLLLPPVAGLEFDGPDADPGPTAGVYHYAPREHLLERRAAIPAETWSALALPPGHFLVALSSIHWREAWKYGERAFRYCQHDVGHALAALAIGAAGLGWRTRLVEGIGTRDIGRLLGLPDTVAHPHPESEHPDCLLIVGPGDGRPRLTTDTFAAFDALPWTGTPNDLSPDHVEWDAIEIVAEAAIQPADPQPFAPWTRAPGATPVETGANGLRNILRQRRSGLAFDGKTGMPAATFFRMMESCMPRAGRVPFASLPWRPRLHLAIFVHRVEGLHPGLYWLQRHPESTELVRDACREEFLWERPEDCPEHLPLTLALPLDLRSQATSVSCGQSIAGDGAFSLGMIAEFDSSLEEHGAWFYPRLFWEAGALGQVLYLEAEATGLRSTGIGCYFDDPMHSILGLESTALQSLYHFTVGQHVEDTRLTDRPAYPAP